MLTTQYSGIVALVRLGRGAWVGLLVVACVAWTPAPAAADEPWLLGIEASAGIPLTDPQRDLYRPGVFGSLALHRPVASWLLLGARVRGGLLFDGPAPADATRADPGLGTLGALELSIRLRPARADDPRRGTGPFIDIGGGVGLTGEEIRGVLDAGIGWGFATGNVDLAPVARYVQVLQPQGGLDGRDAKLLLLGIELTFFDARRAPPPPVEEPPPGDRDGDGYVDPEDGCPDEPEDFDDFEDEDGCPDVDDDRDGILDVDDQCRLEPEDRDGFEDEDGCPDPDNDGDGFLDPNDDCPDEAEIINGNEDQDGCPDEGLIQLVQDRVVLEEHVLFDFERSRVKSAARPVLRAIVELWRQHPEWDELRIEGHADERGNEEFNKELSERRAGNVMRALVELGIPRRIFEFEGSGSARPMIPNADTEEEHQKNRRVEFVIVNLRRVGPDGEVVDEDPDLDDGEAEGAIRREETRLEVDEVGQ